MHRWGCYVRHSLDTKNFDLNRTRNDSFSQQVLSRDVKEVLGASYWVINVAEKRISICIKIPSIWKNLNVLHSITQHRAWLWKTLQVLEPWISLDAVKTVVSIPTCSHLLNFWVSMLKRLRICLLIGLIFKMYYCVTQCIFYTDSTYVQRVMRWAWVHCSWHVRYYYRLQNSHAHSSKGGQCSQIFLLCKNKKTKL